MKLLIFLLEDQECLTWTEYAGIILKDDPDLIKKVTELARECRPNWNKDTKKEIKISFGEDWYGIDGWVYVEDYYTEYETKEKKMYKNAIFAIIEEEI